MSNIKYRLLITGSRFYTNKIKIRAALNHITQDLFKDYKPEEIELVQGGAAGPDKISAEWAKEKGCLVTTFEADWENLDIQPCLIRLNSRNKKYNALAGTIRNNKMGEYVNQIENKACIGFWDQKSRGTKDMLDIAEDKYKIPTVKVNTNEL